MDRRDEAILRMAEDLSSLLERLKEQSKLLAMQQDQVIKLRVRIEKLEETGIERFLKANRKQSDG